MLINVIKVCREYKFIELPNKNKMVQRTNNIHNGECMKHIGKTALATAVSLALSCGASAATFEQYQMGTKSLKEILAGKSNKVSIDANEVNVTPSSYYVVLKQKSLSELRGSGEESLKAAAVTIADMQQSVSNALLRLDRDAKVLTKTKNLAPGLVVQASEQALNQLSSNPAVAGIYPVYDSKPAVADSAEYMNATDIVSSGTATGQGITVAVLDTGIDYTHKAVGGVGTVEAYDAVDPTVAPSWPQGKVLGGYDFINNDPNPIDPADEGHGTFVASSVNGLAPDVEFYAYTVCTQTCPGAAQIAALEAAMDPNGDDDISDHVDIINMSLGGIFGSTQTISGTQLLIQQAADQGVNMVISAGNDGPNPFIVGGPSTTPNALSVGAMTNAVGSEAFFAKAEIAGEAVEMIAAGFNPVNAFSFNSTANPLVYVSTNANGCNAFAAGSLQGAAVLIDRGVCNFTQKVINAQTAGAAFVIIANNAAAAGPVSAGGADPAVTIPAVGISKEDGDAIKAALANGAVAYEITSTAVSSAGGLADFTSRGPSMAGLLKPEITAPGTNIVMAAAGSGDQSALNSGTSFSGPMVAGAAALLREALPERTAQEIKATLMNTANMDVYTVAKDMPGAELAPISAMGAGLADVGKAASSPVAAWVEDAEFDTAQAALSFGFQMLTKPTTLTKTVTLKNFSTEKRAYSLRIQDRFAADTATGALKWTIPSNITVAAGQTRTFDVSVTVDPAKLHEWKLANTSVVADKNAELTDVEYDGALIFDDASTAEGNDLHLVYHILPRANAELKVSNKIINGESVSTLKNDGAVAADVFASRLVATSPIKDTVAFDLRSASLDVVEESLCESGIALIPTLTLENAVHHPQQLSVGVDLDLNNDGIYDYQMYSLLLTRLGTSYAGFVGTLGTFVTPYGVLSGAVMDLFHSSGQRNISLSACFEDIGLSSADVGRTVTARYRTSSNSSLLGAPTVSLLDDSVVASVALLPAPTVTLTSLSASATDISTQGDSTFAVGDKLSSIEPGQEVQVSLGAADSGAGVVLMSAVGDAALVNETPDVTAVPVISETSDISVDENTTTGAVVTQLSADIGVLDSPVAEFVLQSSSSEAFTLNADGSIVVKDASLLNYEAGMTSATLTVVAVNEAGRSSAPATVEVAVNNIPDAAPTLAVTSSSAKIVATETAAGTQVGTVAITINEAGARLERVAVTPSLFAYANGQLTLARMPTKADEGPVTVTIVATDSAGLTSSTTTLNLTVEDAPSGSSGSFGWLSLMLLPLALLRRRRN